LDPELEAFWSLSPQGLLGKLTSAASGLSQEEAQIRLRTFGPNLFKPRKPLTIFTLLLSQYKSPIILILICAALLSFFLGDHPDAIIILVIVLISGLLAFWQEKGATQAVAKLLALVQIKATVHRGGEDRDIPVEEVVPGDVVILKAGDVIPGDARLLASKDLFVDEAALTGETFPVEKAEGVVPVEAPLAQRKNSLFMGTHVVSGTATALVVFTGVHTVFGQIADTLRLRAPETEFERGVRRFGYFLMEVTLLLVVVIFAVNVYLKRPVMDSFLFSLALAVGLTPQLLPAIISINLALGAKRMAGEKVIVKRLAAIENFGSMDVFCADKTGTLTQGVVEIQSVQNLKGDHSDRVLFFAYLNARFETGFASPVDEALRHYCCPDVGGWEKIDEVPYDFVRKRLSLLMDKDGRHLMITKGALAKILEICTQAERDSGDLMPLETVRAQVEQRFHELSQQGFRTLGVAFKDIEGQTITKSSETDMVFLGFLVLHDPPKPDSAKSIKELKHLRCPLKLSPGTTTW
jgi:Mg2+-importing ATPase